jgi:hypothetical protein
LLIAVNIFFALITYFIAVTYLNVSPGLISALICGILFPALLRTRFTIFRPVGEKGDLSIPLDKLYTGIQKRCYREVDSRQAAYRAVKAQNLAAHTEEAKLISALKKIIAARQVEEERKADEEYLKKLAKVADQEMRRYQLAMFLIDIAGGEEDRLLAQ